MDIECGHSCVPAEEDTEQERDGADGVLEPGGVMVVIGRGRVGAAHFRGDAAAAEQAEAIGAVMDAQLEGEAALGTLAQGAGDAFAGDARHFRREGQRDTPVRAGAGVRLAVIKAERALRADGEAQGKAAAGV